MTRWMRDLVEVQGGFKPSVQLPGDFYDDEQNRHFVENFIPNQQIVDVFMSIRDSLMPAAIDRARLFVGTFGTGKSDLMLMIANYLTRSADDPLLKLFFERLRRLDNAKAESIYQARLQKPPFLLALLQAETANTFGSFILNGLKEALERQDKGHLLGKTYYKAAIEQIESWEKLRPDNIKRLEDTLATEFDGRTVARIKSELSGPRGDVALAVFRDSVQRAIGLPFSPTDVFQRPFEAFQDVAEKLVATNQFSGIVAIADEFTSLLTKLGESAGGADSKAIDNLAEAAVRSGPRQLHFYAVSFESFSSIPAVSKASKDALERTGGRFKEFSLTTQNSEEMISVVINKLPSLSPVLELAGGQLDDLLNIAMQLWNTRAHGKKERSWLLQTVVRGCFPLHPLTTFCLPELNRVLAQNNRTMFSFLWDDRHGLQSFINEAKAETEKGWLPLLTVDMLFDYFVDSLQEKRLDMKRAYDDACQKLDPTQEKGLAGRVLRAMIILEIAGQRANQLLLRHAVGKSAACAEEVSQAIGELVQAGTIYPSQTNFYHLVKRGGVDPLHLRRQIDNQARQIGRSAIELLNEQFALESVEATSYNGERNTVRSLTSRFAHPAELSSPATLEGELQYSEGLLWYIVPGNEQEKEESLTNALQLTSHESRLVVAVPNQPSDLQIRLLQKQALVMVRTASEYQAADYQDLLGDHGNIGSDYNEMFTVARRYYDHPNNFTWFRGGRTVSVAIPAHVNNLATAVMEVAFPATPRHGTRQHLGPNSRKQYLNSAIEKLLLAPFKLAAKARKPEDIILLDGANELGFIQRVGQEGGYYEYNVCPPDAKQRESYQIWSLLRDELSKGTDWAEIRSILVEPPYGLYSPIIKLLLASFYRYSQNELEIYETSRLGSKPVDVTADLINRMVETPISFTFRYHPLHEAQAKFLRRFLEGALYTVINRLPSRSETASLRTNVAKYLRTWAATIPLAAHSATLEQLTEIYPSTSTDVLNACVAILQTALLPQEAATAAALLDRLPIQLGLPSDCTHWSDPALNQVLANLEGACQRLVNFRRIFKESIVGHIGQLFGLTTRAKSENDTFNAATSWRQSVAKVEADHLSNAIDARDLIAALDNHTNFDQAFLIFLPQRWQLMAFDQWPSIATYNKYLQKLQAAKAAVDAKSADLSVEWSTPKTISQPTDSIRTAKTIPPNATSAGLPVSSPVSYGAQQRDRVVKEQADKVAKSVTFSQPPKTGSSQEGVDTNKPAIKSGDDAQAKEALRQIVEIIDCLPPNAQRWVWKQLVEAYDPT